VHVLVSVKRNGTSYLQRFKLDDVIIQRDGVPGSAATKDLFKPNVLVNSEPNSVYPEKTDVELESTEIKTEPNDVKSVVEQVVKLETNDGEIEQNQVKTEPNQVKAVKDETKVAPNIAEMALDQVKTETDQIQQDIDIVKDGANVGEKGQLQTVCPFSLLKTFEDNCHRIHEVPKDKNLLLKVIIYSMYVDVIITHKGITGGMNRLSVKPVAGTCYGPTY